MHDTIVDATTKTLFDLLDRPNEYGTKRLDMLQDVIVVHLRFLQPKVDEISPKYSVMDKFANFGGNYGIFAELTGCSFIVVLNFFLILFKSFFKKT